MTIYAIARAFAIIVLGGPVVLVAVGLACTYIPGAADVLSNLFWSSMGEIPIFALASNVLELLLEEDSITMENFTDSFLAVLFDGASDALILSCCIFGVKSANVSFNRKFEGRFLQREWRMTLLGVLLGVFAITVKGELQPLFRALLTFALCTVLFLYGIRLMLGRKTTSSVYNNRRAGFMITMMVDILANMFTAMSAVMLVTCVMEGPHYIRQGGSLLVWIACCVLSVLFLYITNLITAAMRRTRG